MKTRAFVQQLPKSPWLAESGTSVVSLCNFRGIDTGLLLWRN